MQFPKRIETKDAQGKLSKQPWQRCKVRSKGFTLNFMWWQSLGRIINPPNVSLNRLSPIRQSLGRIKSQACPGFATFGRSNLPLVVCDQYNGSLSQPMTDLHSDARM